MPGCLGFNKVIKYALIIAILFSYRPKSTEEWKQGVFTLGNSSLRLVGVASLLKKWQQNTLRFL